MCIMKTILRWQEEQEAQQMEAINRGLRECRLVREYNDARGAVVMFRSKLLQMQRLQDSCSAQVPRIAADAARFFRELDVGPQVWEAQSNLYDYLCELTGDRIVDPEDMLLTLARTNCLSPLIDYCETLSRFFREQAELHSPD